MKLSARIQKLNLYPLLIFISAFLLFQIQPIISRYILPWFGGSPNVWIVSLLFFQVILLAGYAYAYFLIRFFRPIFQVGFYVILLLIAILLLPITPAEYWKNYALGDPTLVILGLLLINIGLPYFILSATSPLFQAWFSQQFPKTSPYRLYSLSNLGSLLGLITYPFIIEPIFGVRFQTQLWSIGFILFTLVVILLTFQKSHQFTKQKIKAEKPVTPVKRPRLFQQLLWIILPALASGMLLAVTNYITQDVATVPLLWILPLAIYLFSFIVTFNGDEFYDRHLIVQAFVLVSCTLALVLTQGFSASVIMTIIIFLIALLMYTIFCHGELAHLKPAPQYLTSFYLAISFGGALGGVFVALIAPLIFPAYLELNFLIISTYLLLIIILLIDRGWLLYPKYPIRSWSFIIILFLLTSYLLGSQAFKTVKNPWFISRDFYGVIRIFQIGTNQENHQFSLYNGGTLHGCQFSLPEKQCLATTYYGSNSGVGLAFKLLEGRKQLRIGAVGLGTGTLATYANNDSYIRFYEINPNVKLIAEKYFTFLTKCASRYDVILGDARLSLEKEEPQQFDILALDAFSSDAIPVHLLTKESIEIYLRHLKPDGILAVHISNRYINLRPVVVELAKHFNLASVIIEGESDKEKAQAMSSWALLSPDHQLLNNEIIQSAGVALPKSFSPFHLWTDDYSNLLWVLRFW